MMTSEIFDICGFHKNTEIKISVERNIILLKENH